MAESLRNFESLRDRRSAVFLCVAISLLSGGLTGCINSQNSPVLATLGAFVPGGGTDVSNTAAEVDYASIKFSAGHRSGLLILSEQVPGLTFWQSSQAETVVLQNGYLQSTAGLDENLQMTKFDGLDRSGTDATLWPGELSSPIEYKVLRTWRTLDGRLRSGTASATLTCSADVMPLQLPLARLPLKKCAEAMTWGSGKRTKSTYWIDPKDNRIWAGNVVPWPGGPEYSWQVARPWW